jgi:AcrR family transcriptional regulator
LPRRPDPDVEQRILAAASRLWARGGERLLTMRAVAKAAGTTTPTVYERFRDRDDILRGLRLRTRRELFAALMRTQSLHDAIERQLEFALENHYAYEVLFDGVGQPPSLHEPWPSFNLMRERLAREIGGTPREHNRLILAIWSLMHGTAMLIIRGGFEEPLRTQAMRACLDTVDTIVLAAKKGKGLVYSGPKWPPTLILGKGERSRVGNGDEERLQNKVKRSRSRR